MTSTARLPTEVAEMPKLIARKYERIDSVNKLCIHLLNTTKRIRPIRLMHKDGGVTQVQVACKIYVAHEVAFLMAKMHCKQMRSIPHQGCSPSRFTCIRGLVRLKATNSLALKTS
jgi:hypothetical protein